MGPSLAAVGEAVGITLPTTAAFQMRGALWWHGERTNVKVVQARIGDSRLSGDFTHDHGTTPPSLVGVLPLQRQGRAPLASGMLSGRIVVNGRGRSTAGLLGTLGGHADLALCDGQVSHLGIELAGLDLMEGLAEFISGDESLPISCAQVRQEARDGVLRPAPAIVTTPDSTLWADGPSRSRTRRSTCAPASRRKTSRC